MSVKIDLSNNYISANNAEEPNRLKFYDSDGKYIDYISMDNYGHDYGDYSDMIAQIFFRSDRCQLPDREIAELLASYFHDVDDVIYSPDFDELDEMYGEEFINRIGSCALIIKE